MSTDHDHTEIEALRRECERLRAELENNYQLAFFWRRYNDDRLRDAMHDFNCGLEFGPMCGCVDCRIAGRAEGTFVDGDENGRCMFAPRFTQVLEYYGLGNIAYGVDGIRAGSKAHLSAVVMSGVFDGVDPAADFHCANGNPAFTMFSYGPAVWGCTAHTDEKLRRLRRLFAALESSQMVMEDEGSDEDEDEEEEEDDEDEGMGP